MTHNPRLHHIAYDHPHPLVVPLQSTEEETARLVRRHFLQSHASQRRAFAVGLVFHAASGWLGWWLWAVAVAQQGYDWRGSSTVQLLLAANVLRAVFWVCACRGFPCTNELSLPEWCQLLFGAEGHVIALWRGGPWLALDYELFCTTIFAWPWWIRGADNWLCLFGQLPVLVSWCNNANTLMRALTILLYCTGAVAHLLFMYAYEMDSDFHLPSVARTPGGHLLTWSERMLVSLGRQLERRTRVSGREFTDWELAQYARRCVWRCGLSEDPRFDPEHLTWQLASRLVFVLRQLQATPLLLRYVRTCYLELGWPDVVHASHAPAEWDVHCEPPERVREARRALLHDTPSPLPRPLTLTILEYLQPIHAECCQRVLAALAADWSTLHPV